MHIDPGGVAVQADGFEGPRTVAAVGKCAGPRDKRVRVGVGVGVGVRVSVSVSVSISVRLCA